MQQLLGLLLQRQEILRVGGESIERILGALKIGCSDLQTCLPDEDLWREVQRIGIGLLAYEERGERGLGRGSLPTSKEQQDTQKFYFCTHIFFAKGEIVSIFVARCLTQ